MESVEELISRQAEMKTERAREEAQWRSIAEVFGPEAIDLDVHSKSTYDTSEIFDSTGLYARDAFVGGIFGQLTNPSNRWLGLGLDDADLEAWPPVADWLQRVSSRILGTADVGSSQFYSQVPAWLADLGMFGLGTGYSEKLPGGRYVDLAVPLGQTFIERDIYGSVTRLHREMMLTGRQLKRKFGPVERFEDKQSYVIVHAVRENDDFRPGRLGRNGMRWASTYFAIGEKDWRRDGGYEENPYFCVPWTERAGRTYPVGPGHLARPDGQMLQEMERAHLVAAQRAAEPSVGMPEDSILTAADFVP
ncbi:MAG TPA: portal protein, partial [Hyphomicrobiales bacterium]|nr:portal protein [Hyphomicrobiales bacterium]